jgi:membrane protein YqaA with SNARE-associated domain
MEGFWALFHEYGVMLAREYGLGGLFAASLLGSTIFFPFSAEVAITALAAAGVSKIAILLTATVGSILGSAVNYYLGYRGISLADRYVKKEDLAKASRIMNRYGWAGVFAALALPLPLPVDPLTVLCGAAKMSFREFVAVVAAGKALKYSLVLGALSLIF